MAVERNNEEEGTKSPLRLAYEQYQKFLKKKSKFKHLDAWSYPIAVCNFVVFFVAFLLLCFAFSQIDSNPRPGNVYEFEKYVTLAAALFALIPVLFSLLLSIGIVYKKENFLFAWLISYVLSSVIYICGLLGAGIYLVIEGSAYVGSVAIVLPVLFGFIFAHSFLVIYYVRQTFERDAKRGEQEMENSEGSSAAESAV